MPLTLHYVDPVRSYSQFLQEIFDFDLIRSLIANKDFTITLDAMNGCAGIYF